MAVGALTLFAFSSENWRRPRDEVMSLMALFVESLEAEIGELHSNGVRLRFIGERAELDERLRASMAQLRADHAGQHRGCICRSRSATAGAGDIVEAARRLARARRAARAEAGGRSTSPRSLRRWRWAGLPDPDLFIRTGGEQRISNFLLWNLAYTELYFTECLWPDFDASQLRRSTAALRHAPAALRPDRRAARRAAAAMLRRAMLIRPGAGTAAAGRGPVFAAAG